MGIDNAGGIDVAAAAFVVVVVVGKDGIVRVEGAGSGDNASGIVVVATAVGIGADDAVQALTMLAVLELLPLLLSVELVSKMGVELTLLLLLSLLLSRRNTGRM